jgi:hypothetical protein
MSRTEIEGYSHVCTACGATMQVHVRYYGRTLRCTTCRTEFVAKRPMIPPPAEEPAQPRKRAKRERRSPAFSAQMWRWVIVAAVLVAVVTVSLWWLGGDRKQGVGRELFAVTKVRTDLGVLRRDGDEHIVVALDREAVQELIGALRAGNQETIDALISSSRFIQVEPGTRIRVLERRKRGAEARVRILDGPWVSRIVWVPAEWIE